ncbi:CDGSH iron-sulfur domain-containing protein [Streptomyces sp. AC563]|nr:CDGSH iron-sulfur domain-containing protein [Streptomyces buecherae]
MTGGPGGDGEGRATRDGAPEAPYAAPAATTAGRPDPLGESTPDAADAAPVVPSSPVREASPSGREARPTRVVVVPEGPLLLDGPVEVELGDGRTAYSDRPQVALCVCRRSRSYPWCDTSHRRRGPHRRDTPTDTD